MEVSTFDFTSNIQTKDVYPLIFSASFIAAAQTPKFKCKVFRQAWRTLVKQHTWFVVKQNAPRRIRTASFLIVILPLDPVPVAGWVSRLSGYPCAAVLRRLSAGSPTSSSVPETCIKARAERRIISRR